MSSTILLIVLLSAHITGLISEQLLKATVGGSVLFHCPLHDNGNLIRVYWQEGEQHFFLWDNGNITKDPSKYKNRTQFFDDKFSSGNISFRLDNISVEDDQKTFFAYVKFDKPIQSERRCENMLQVSAPYQDLVLTVKDTTNTATCSARGGYPAAKVSWKGLNRTNDEQLDLQDAETFLQQDPTEKTFSFTSSVNVTGLKSVTCIVYNPHSHETVNRTEKIDIGEIKRIDVAAIVVPVVLFLLVIVGAVLWYKKQSPNLNPDAAREPVDLNPQDPDQGEGQAQAPEPAPAPANPPSFHSQAEAADAPDETASLTATGAAYRRHTKLSEDVAAPPEKENLLK